MADSELLFGGGAPERRIQPIGSVPDQCEGRVNRALRFPSFAPRKANELPAPALTNQRT